MNNPGTPPDSTDLRPARIDFSLPTPFQASPGRFCWRAPLPRTSEIRLSENRRVDPPLPSALRRRRLLWPLLTSRSVSPRRPFSHKTRSPRVRTHSFTARPPDLRRLTFDHKSFAEFGPLALIGTALYPVLVHRPAASLHASSPRSVALPQLRFTSLAVVSLREDFYLLECARAGRTKQKRGPKAPFLLTHLHSAHLPVRSYVIPYLYFHQPRSGRCDHERIGTRVISTRRFWARPDSVSLLATGRDSPAPTRMKRSRTRPFDIR